jgi:large subunit ribosomal protein L18
MSLKSPQERWRFGVCVARRKIYGTAEKPRLSVYRAQKHMYAQLVDDAAGRTLAAASSLVADLKKLLKTGANVEAAAKVGETIAEKPKP